MSKLDIHIKELKNEPFNDHKSSMLKLQLSGKDIHTKIVNALRRVACNNIPIYAFPPELITIEENTCVAFNNDYMKSRLCNLPIMQLNDLDNDLAFLHEQYWKNVNYADLKREKHQSEKNVTLYVNIKNTTNSILNVTTNDAKIYIDEKEIEKPYNTNYPYLIIKLRPNDSFKCFMKAALGIGENKAYWNCSRNAYHEVFDDNIYSLTIASNGQLKEYDILIKACHFLNKKLEDIKNEMLRMLKTGELEKSNIIEFVLEGETHTIGELLNYEFQSHKDIHFSGVSKPDLMVNTMIIKVQGEHDTPSNAMLECIDLLVKKFNYILKLLEKMKK